jgi:hypothetical protein
MSALESSLYAQDEWSISPEATANIGVRVLSFSRGKYLAPDPRFSLSYKTSDEVTLKGSFSFAHQFLHLINHTEIFLPTDVWFASTSSILPSESWQVATGLETTLLGDEYNASVEVYYRNMKNLYEYKDFAFTSSDNSLETQLARGDGNAYGCEFFINKRIGSFTGWLGYTLSWTKQTFPELNLGRPFYPTYDRRHDISIVLSYRLGQKWEIGATWVYRSGQAATLPSGFYLYAPIGSSIPTPFGHGFTGTRLWSPYDYVSDRNGYRYPAYHRLDLNFMYNRKVFGLDSQFSVNLYNAYDHFNPFYVEVTTDNDQQPPKPVLRKYTLFPFIPTIGWSFKF